MAFIAPASSGTPGKVTTSKPVLLRNGFTATSWLSAGEAVLRICTRSLLFDWPSATRSVSRACGETREASKKPSSGTWICELRLSRVLPPSKRTMERSGCRAVWYPVAGS